MIFGSANGTCHAGPLDLARTMAASALDRYYRSIGKSQLLPALHSPDKGLAASMVPPLRKNNSQLVQPFYRWVPTGIVTAGPGIHVAMS